MHKLLAFAAVALIAAAPALADRAARQAADMQAGEAQLAKLTKGLVPGPAEACAPQQRWSNSTNIDGIGILYENGSQHYLNRFPADCAHFDWTEIPVIVSNGMSCRGDFVRFVDSTTGFTRGACTLGDFIPYTRPKG